MRRCSVILALCVVTAFNAHGGEDDWKKEVSVAPAGKFPDLPGVRMHFSFGWSNVLEAGNADATIQRRSAEYRAVVSGKSTGLARTLWSLDAQHVAAVFAPSLLPKHFAQIERYGNRTIETQVRFDDTGLDRLRKVSTSKDPEKWKRVNFTPVRDVIGGVLYVRSLPLNVGDEIGVVCFPGDSPYLVVVKVERRETIRCMGKDRPALRLSLSIRKLEVKKKKPVTAVGYEKFHSGTVWVSDDALRLPLRAEVSVFIGFVYGELTKFEKL